MDRYEKIIKAAKKLPGFYGYRPEITGSNTVHIREVIFHLEEKEKDMAYIMVLYFKKGICVRKKIDARYNDASVVEVEENNPAFITISRYASDMMTLFNLIK